MVPAFYNLKLSILEPSATINSKCLALGRSLIIPAKNRSVCGLINLTDTSVFLRRHETIIAVIKDVSLDSISVISNESKPAAVESNHTESRVLLEQQQQALREKDVESWEPNSVNSSRL